MRTTIVAMIFASGTMIALPAQAQQQQTTPNSQMQQMQEEADKGVKTRQSGESGYVGEQEKSGSSAHPPGRTTGEASRDPTVKEMNAKEKGKVEKMGK
jgi:hypothetical protein